MVGYEPLTPCLRLFLSVDIQGSTAFKYSPIERSAWLSVILRFYTEFPRIFFRHFDRLEQDIKSGGYGEALSSGLGSPPFLWKSIGDELVFVKEISHPIEAVETLRAFQQTILDFQKVIVSISEGLLDLKGSSWTAGFPIINMEFPIVDYRDNPTLESQEFSISEETDEHVKSRLHIFSYEQGHSHTDFIGPSIDIGFRLGKWSTPRQFVISVDLAYLLCECLVQLDKADRLELIYDEGEKLKGVLRDSVYPKIWVDMTRGKGQKDKHERLLARKGVELMDLREVCGEYLDSAPKLVRPYIVGSNPENPVFGEIPNDHAEKTRKILELSQIALRKEEQFHRSMQEEGEGNSELHVDISKFSAKPRRPKRKKS